MKFIDSEAALCIGKTLVISDLHLGIEYDFYKSGITLPSQTGKAAEKIMSIIDKTRCKKLIILGDIKHKVPGSSFQEQKEIPHFFSYLSETVKIEIVKGNHDAGIEKYLPGNVRMHAGSGFLYREHYLCHGHALPGKDVLEARRIITGHLHAVIEVKDRLGYRWTQKVWVRAKPLKARLMKAFASAGKIEEIIAMPAFSDFVGGKPIGEAEPMGPVMKMASMRNAELYLLDGTYIGVVGNLQGDA